MAFSVLLGLITWAVPAVSRPSTAQASETPGDTYIRDSNTLYAYVGEGENLDVVFTKIADEAGANNSSVTVTAPDGSKQSCQFTAHVADGTKCSFLNLTSDTAGIWQIDFVVDSFPSDRMDWDITVQNGNTDIPGRVWSTDYTVRNVSPTDLTVYYLSEQGFLYQADYTNYMGVDSNISVDSTGNTLDGTCTSAYKSYDYGTPAEGFPYGDEATYDTPRDRAPGTCGDPYKIFFEKPAADLPATGKLPDGTTTWINPQLTLPTLTSLDFNQTGTDKRSGTFTVGADNFTGQATVQVDVNGTGTVDFDGLDGNGNAIDPHTDMSARAIIDHAGEIHFVNWDVEERDGIQVTALNGPQSGSTKLYWDDTDLRTAGRDCTTPQLDGTAGVDSTGGVHGWTCDDSANDGVTGSWGDYRYIDDWTYQTVDREKTVDLPGAQQPTFQCSAQGLLFQYPDGTPTQVIGIDMITGASHQIGTIDGYSINAVAYNTLDNYIYGWDADMGQGAGLVRIGSDLSVVKLGTPAGTEGTKLVGDIDDQGHYWVSTLGGSRTWYEFDVDPSSATYGQLLDQGTAALPSEVTEQYGFADWAFVPGTNALWGIAADGNQAVLIKFDRTTKQFTVTATLGTLGDNHFGAVYADPNGYLYGSENDTGGIYRVDVRAGTAEFLADGPSSDTNDGARCAAAPLPIDFGDAPDSYGTTLKNDGARHSVPDYNETDHTAPLMLGKTIDIENDGVPGAAANGDDRAGQDDEDGVASPVVISATSPTTVTVSATNNTDQRATLAGWIDLNGNGTFDPSESVTATVPANSGTADYKLEFPAATATEGVYARFRIFPGPVDDPSPTGSASAGEVEDYPVQVRQLAIQKTSDADEATRIGDTVHYTVKVTNTGSSDYTAGDPASFQDDLTGVLDDADYNKDASASTGTVHYDKPRLSWSGPLAAGASATITYSVTLTGAGDTKVDNVAFVTDCTACDPPAPPADACATDGVNPANGLACAPDSFEVPKLEIDKTADTTELPVVGQTVTYTIVATNNGAGAYTAADPATVLDDLSGVLDDATVDQSSITASVGAAPTYSKPLISWSGPLASGDSVTISYQVTYTGGGDHRLVNTAWEPRDPDDPTPPACDPADADGRDPATGEACGRVVIPAADLQVSKSVDPKDGSTVTAGEKLTYTITFGNDGTAAADVAGWTDDLAGVLDDAKITSGPKASDDDLSVSDVTDDQFTVDGTVPAGATYTVTYTVRVLPDGQRGNSELDNFVVKPGDTPPGPDGRCAAGDPLCTSNPVPQIDVTKSVDPQDGSTVTPGQVLTYTLTFTNSGKGVGAVDKVDDLSQVLDDATVTKAPVASSDAVSVSAIKHDQFEVTGSLAAGRTVTVTYRVTVKAADDLGDGELANFVINPGDTPPAGPDDCRAGDPTCTQNPAPKISDSKSVDPKDGSTVTPGQKLTYTLTFTNSGAAAGAVDRVDDLSQLLDDATITKAPVVSDDALTVSKVANSRFTIKGTLQPGQKVTITYQATVRAQDQLGDTQVANFLINPGDPTPPAGSCQPSDPDCTENPVPRIDDKKSVDPESGSSVQPGQALTYTLTFTNTGAAVGKVDRVDDLTQVLDDAEVTSAPKASAKALSVSAMKHHRYAITGSLKPGQTVTVSYRVTVNSAGHLGDSELVNFLLDPADPTPSKPVCDGGSDCTENPVSDVSVVKSASPSSETAVGDGQLVSYTLSFTNDGKARGTVDYTDYLAGVLDDADLVGQPAASDPALSVHRSGDRLRITGDLAGGQSATVRYRVRVKPYADQGDHELGNFVTVTGQRPPKQCASGSRLCTEHPTKAPAPAPQGPGGLAQTGSPAGLLPIALAGLGMLTLGGGLALRRRAQHQDVARTRSRS